MTNIPLKQARFMTDGWVAMGKSLPNSVWTRPGYLDSIWCNADGTRGRNLMDDRVRSDRVEGTDIFFLFSPATSQFTIGGPLIPLPYQLMTLNNVSSLSSYFFCKRNCAFSMRRMDGKRKVTDPYIHILIIAGKIPEKEVQKRWFWYLTFRIHIHWIELVTE